jgi:glycolate oxidase FAD binding subunit
VSLGGPAREALERAAGAGALREHAPIALEGAALSFTLRPASAEAMAAALGVLDREGLAALVRGGGSRLAAANPLSRADLLLETGGLAAPPEVDAEEGVARVAAGTTVSELRERARAAGWEAPLDPPGPAATVGGTLATAAVGPCSPHPRDLVLGLEVALASGELAHCGGRVVKNVTGYDLAKLYVGSCGSLGVITSAWLRLRPLPETVVVLEAELPADEEHAVAAALGAARRATTRACGLVDATLLEGGWTPGRRLVVELAGDAPAVQADRDGLASALGTAPAAEGRVDAMRALQGRVAEGGLRLRVASVAGGLVQASGVLHGAGARLLVQPGKGLLHAFFDGARSMADLARAFEAGRAAARAGRGSLLLESAPLALRQGVDVFDPPPAWLRLFRALKHQYDPKGVLNPGRFAGGL